MSGAIAKGTLLKDRYCLERPLGHGGMASVWLGHDRVLDRPVAIKVLSDTIASDPEFVARFRREARVAAGVTHANLVGVYDYSDGDERPYLVMQLVPGDSLAAHLSRGSSVDCERLAKELLGALAHIHQVGILHRDIKPHNILIEPDQTAKLIDFGIALPRDATSLTRTGLILGTERYAAPEVMEGAPATERSDLYSCGVVLRLCQGEDPSDLATLVDWLTSRDPRSRPASALQALALLDRRRALAGQPTQAFEPTFTRFDAGSSAPPAVQTPEPTPTRRSSRSEHRHGRWVAPLAAIAVLGAIALGVVLATSGGSDEAGRSGSITAQKSRGEERTKPAANGEAQAPAEVPSDGEASSETEPATTESEPESSESAVPSGEDPALGSALNDEGYELIQAGRYEEAVPVLEESVRSFPPGSEDAAYAYALFNLGNALRLSGRADEAIPVLERRLQIPDQTETVQLELAEARREAG